MALRRVSKSSQKKKKERKNATAINSFIIKMYMVQSKSKLIVL